MENLVEPFWKETWIPFPVIVGRLLLAAVLGAMVGIEREWRRRLAGLRTHILICLTTAAIAILAIEITHVEDFGGQEIRIDPLRLLEATTAGVAFLAAGLIFFAKGDVHGLTTGAGMWLAGAMGLAVGLGFWQIAVVLTIAALVVLSAACPAAEAAAAITASHPAVRRLEARTDRRNPRCRRRSKLAPEQTAHR